MIRHRKFRVNNHIVDIPSYMVKVNDKLNFKSASSFLEIIPPGWLNLNKKGNYIEVLSEPRREDIHEDVNEHLIVEYYSR